MWHHKTKVGTFWIVESDKNHEYTLGFDNETLGCYNQLERVITDIKSHETGNLKWDMSEVTTIPEDMHHWSEGEPENWNKF